MWTVSATCWPWALQILCWVFYHLSIGFPWGSVHPRINLWQKESFTFFALFMEAWVYPSWHFSEGHDTTCIITNPLGYISLISSSHNILNESQLMVISLNIIYLELSERKWRVNGNIIQHSSFCLSQVDVISVTFRFVGFTFASQYVPICWLSAVFGYFWLANKDRKKTVYTVEQWFSQLSWRWTTHLYQLEELYPRTGRTCQDFIVFYKCTLDTAWVNRKRLSQKIKSVFLSPSVCLWVCEGSSSFIDLSSLWTLD